MFALYKKEIRFFLNNPIGYIVIILFAVFANFFYVKDIFIVGSGSMRPFFMFTPWLLMIFIPAMAMRSFAEEKKANTLETLLSLPLSEAQIVAAKFMAIMSLFVVGLSLTVALPIMLFILTRTSIAEIIISYAGVLLMGSFFTALSLFLSLKTKNQIVAFLSSAFFIFILNVLATDFLGTSLPKELLNPLIYYSPQYHFDSFLKGVVDIRAVFYFLSFTVAFLYLAIKDLNKKI